MDMETEVQYLYTTDQSTFIPYS